MFQCYSCDAVKGSALPCDGAAGKGVNTTCAQGQKCGLLLEERLHYDRFHSRWAVN